MPDGGQGAVSIRPVLPTERREWRAAGGTGEVVGGGGGGSARPDSGWDPRQRRRAGHEDNGRHLRVGMAAVVTGWWWARVVTAVGPRSDGGCWCGAGRTG